MEETTSRKAKTGRSEFQGKTADGWKRGLASDERVVRLQAAVALGEIGPAGLAALVDALKHSDNAVRYWAAKGLGKIGDATESAVGALLGALEDESGNVRVSAAYSLYTLGRREEGVAALSDALKHPSPKVRLQAANELTRTGPEAKAAIPALKAALEDKERYVAGASRTAIAIIEGGK